MWVRARAGNRRVAHAPETAPEQAQPQVFRQTTCHRSSNCFTPQQLIFLAYTRQCSTCSATSTTLSSLLQEVACALAEASGPAQPGTME